jgi:hypothetical protein
LRGDIHRVELFSPDGRFREAQHYHNGRLHAASGPAVIKYVGALVTKYEGYYQNGKLHRRLEDGPAEIIRNRRGEVIEERYWRNGVRVAKPTLPATGKRINAPTRSTMPGRRRGPSPVTPER